MAEQETIVEPPKNADKIRGLLRQARKVGANSNCPMELVGISVEMEDGSSHRGLNLIDAKLIKTVASTDID